MTELKDILNRMLEEQIQTRQLLTRIEYHLLINAVGSEIPDISDGEKLTTSLSKHTKSQLEAIRFSMKLLHDALPEANEEAINKYRYNNAFEGATMPQYGYRISSRILGETKKGSELLKRLTAGKPVKHSDIEKCLQPIYGWTHPTRLRETLTSCAKLEERKGSYPKDSEVMKLIKNFEKGHRKGEGKKFPTNVELTEDEFFSIIWLFWLALGFPSDPDKSYMEVDDL